MNQAGHFKLCSTCKVGIPYAGKYYKCSVSTCNKKATALYFCSVPCWDAHVPDAKHRDAWAEEERAPSGPELDAHPTTAAVRRVVSARTTASPAGAQLTASDTDDSAQDVLIVMSKLKGYIKAASDLRTSDGVADPLSDHVRSICRAAIESARHNGRGTVLDRDIEAAISGTTAKD
jgi:histone H3/H4